MNQTPPGFPQPEVPRDDGYALDTFGQDGFVTVPMPTPQSSPTSPTASDYPSATPIYPPPSSYQQQQGHLAQTSSPYLKVPSDSRPITPVSSESGAPASVHSYHPHVPNHSHSVSSISPPVHLPSHASGPYLAPPNNSEHNRPGSAFSASITVPPSAHSHISSISSRAPQNAPQASSTSAQTTLYTTTPHGQQKRNGWKKFCCCVVM